MDNMNRAIDISDTPRTILFLSSDNIAQLPYLDGNNIASRFLGICHRRCLS